ncbi:MAG: hypothetical protein AAF492_32695, partial [Verrucomicrobiota bacterium]
AGGTNRSVNINVGALDFIPAWARFVEVRKNGTSNTRLHVGEIEVFAIGVIPDDGDGDGTSQNDLVQAGTPSTETPPTTTLLSHGSPASVYDGDLESGAEVWTTANGLAFEPLYMLDLGATYPIDLVRVWGRFDGCCQDRLQDFNVTLYADDGGGQPGAEVNTVRFPGTAPAAATGPIELNLAVFDPPIDLFTADRTFIPEGLPVTFSWEVNPDFDTVSIDQGIGDVTGQTGTNGMGSLLLTPGPMSDTIYTLTLVRPGFTNQATLQIRTTDLPVIDAFAADQTVVAPSSTVQLTWSVLNADTILINGMNQTGTNALSVNPAASTVYTLTALNPNGSTSETVNVTT